MLPEVQAYLNMIETVRGQVVRLLEEVEAEALDWRPLAGDDHATNSLAVLAAHVAGSEHFWIAEVIGQRQATRIRAQEFETRAADAATLLARLAAVASETREVLAELDEADLGQERVARPLSGPDGRAEEHTAGVRWTLLHVVEHSALHLGHMQLTRQLWQARQQRGESM